MDPGIGAGKTNPAEQLPSALNYGTFLKNNCVFDVTADCRSSSRSLSACFPRDPSCLRSSFETVARVDGSELSVQLTTDG